MDAKSKTAGARGTNRLRITEKIVANRSRPRGDRKPCIAHSRRRSGRCKFLLGYSSPCAPGVRPVA
jgi:hypothetical protein